MHFDLIDLRLFVNTVEAGSITSGAERSHLSLASASERIRGMEDNAGVTLLVRERRGVQPTAAGHMVLRHARLVLQQMQQLQSEMHDFGEGLAGQVHLLCNTSTISEHLPRPLAAFLALHPRISLHIEDRTSSQIADALRAGTAQLGIAADNVDLQGLQTLPFRPDPLVLVVPRDHALAGARSVSLADAVDLDFIGLANENALQTLLARQAQQLGKRLHFRARLNHLEAVCQLVGLGTGVAIMPRIAAQRHARALGVKGVALTDAWANRQMLICCRNFDELPAPAQALVGQLKGD
ncbi:LysR family transcriptional regulator [Diaphorobacter aerolatus]|uniref:LysR family transcriptional regulator n=1 Tax=Diaphorobacter aerolatus TaxID=1288495 RepID=A0A7H0GQ37_9BURK|nr:LysR family transcriptional regulator [Diaphorobacter aerolatus]